jgi:large subunit ribosomal protein L5
VEEKRNKNPKSKMQNQRLHEKYIKEVIPAMMAKFGYKSPMVVPRIEKVVINTGFGRMAVSSVGEGQRQLQESITTELAALCGQKPVLTRAKKSISSFKLRKGMIVGARVTLRRKRMYDFLERLIHIALPRTRDFRGIPPSSFDKAGNLTIGIKEHTVFPEVNPEKVRHLFGLEITVVTNAKTREEGIELLRLMGFPIKT